MHVKHLIPLTSGTPAAMCYVRMMTIPLALRKVLSVCCKTPAAEVHCALQTEQAGLLPWDHTYTHLCIFSDTSNFTPESVTTPRESSTACGQHTWQQRWRSEVVTASYDRFLEGGSCINKKKNHPVPVCHFPALWAYFWKANLPKVRGRDYCREAHFEPYTHLFFTVFPVPHFSVDQSTHSKTIEKCYAEGCTHEGNFRESPLEEKVK